MATHFHTLLEEIEAEKEEMEDHRRKVKEHARLMGEYRRKFRASQAAIEEKMEKASLMEDEYMKSVTSKLSFLFILT